MVQNGGEGDGAGRLGDQVGVGEINLHRVENLLLRDGDNAVDVLENVLEVELAEGLGAEAVGDGAGSAAGGPLDEGFGFEGFLGISGNEGFRAEDLDVRVADAGFGGELDAGGGTAE